MDAVKTIEQDLFDEIELLIQVVGRICNFSMQQDGISTDGRGMRAMKLFTRQTLSAVSLTKLLPGRQDAFESWDIPSYASITRNIIECFVSLYYYGTELISDSEAQLRFYLLQYHRNSEWFNIRKKELCPEEYAQFENGLRSEKLRLKMHPFLDHLDAEERNKVLKGAEMYRSKAFYESKLAVCADLRNNYRFLSNLAHPLPLSVERMNNENGRGIGSEADLNYFLMCTMLSRKYLAATAMEINTKFSDSLGKRCAADFKFLEPLVTKDFV